MTEPTGQRWVVTGGSRGIGAAIVGAAVAAGHRVANLSRSVEPGGSCASDGAAELLVRADVSDPESLAAAARVVGDVWGGVDVLVNNAGVHRGGKLANLPREAFLEVVTTNLVGPFDTIRAFLPLMEDGAAIVNIGAVVGLRGFPGDVAYASAKAGITGLTYALALELAPRAITVNVVVPGFTATDMTSGLSERARESILGRIPMRREAEAAEVAEVVLNVAGSRYTTGAVIPVDGGLLAALGSAR